MMTSKKIKKLNELVKIVKNLKKGNKKIVTTNGCFDIIHIGHIKSFEMAKKLGDILIVAINTDRSVKKNKGEKRPINSEKIRAEQVAALENVDYVVIFDEDDPCKLLEKIKPDTHVKGKDREMSQIIEKDIVEKNGGKVVLLPLYKGFSTTELINKILSVYNE